MDVVSAEAGPGPSSFRSFASSLADSRHLTLSGRLSSGDPTQANDNSQLGTAIRFAHVCLERAAAAESAEVGFSASATRGHSHLDFGLDGDTESGEDDRANWILEARTWELLHYLSADRYLHHPSAKGDAVDGFSEDDTDTSADFYYQTPFAAVQDILHRNRELREVKIVRDWLSSQLPAVHVAEVRKGYAPFSKNRLRAEKRTQINSRSSKSTNTIKSLDPDAESRGQGKWDHEDASYAKALHRTLFEYARSGQLAAAFDLCEQADQPWRAASLRGAMLYQQQALDGLDANDDEAMTTELSTPKASGNRNRLLWKAVCKRLATNTSLDPYERALYGSLAGHLGSVLAVSSSDSWEEHLWAHINACLESRIEGAFEERGAANGSGSWWTQGGGKGSINLTELRGEKTKHTTEDIRTEIREIFARVKGGFSAGVADSKGQGYGESLKLQADDPYRVVQQAIILDEVPELLIQVESRLSEMRANIRPKRYAHLVRFFAHLVLYLRLLGKVQLPASSCNSILRHYVEVLEDIASSTSSDDVASDGELVAMYASSLERESAEESYAHYLKGLNDLSTIEVKQEALLRAKQHELDVAAVARLVVQVIFAETYPLLQQANSPLADSSGLLSSGLTSQVDVTPHESRLIASIDWLTFLSSTRGDAVFQSNALMRAFLSRGRLHAAKTLLYALPSDLLEPHDDPLEDDSDPDATKLRPSDRTEQLHYHSFFHLLSSHLALVEVLGQRPIASGGAQAARRTDLFAWKEAVVDLGRAARSETEELLRGDWLKLDHSQISEGGDEEEDDDEDNEETERRHVELARIRQMYVPELVLRLHFLLSDVYGSLQALVLEKRPQAAAKSAAVRDGTSAADERAMRESFLEYITADLPVLVADERYKVYLEFVSSSGGSSNNRLKEYLGHVRDAYVVKLGGGRSAATRPEDEEAVFASRARDPFL